MKAYKNATWDSRSIEGVWSNFWLSLLVPLLCSLTVHIRLMSGLGASKYNYQRTPNIANRCPCQVKRPVCFDFSFNLVFNYNFKVDKLWVPKPKSGTPEKWADLNVSPTLIGALQVIWRLGLSNFSRGKQTLAYSIVLQQKFYGYPGVPRGLRNFHINFQRSLLFFAYFLK